LSSVGDSDEVKVRVLMTCMPSLSHATQLVPIARALGDRGHEVILATSPRYALTLRQYGLAAEAVGPDFLLRDGDPVYERTVRSRLFFGFIDLADVMVPDLIALAQARNVDLVVRDSTEFGGWIVARKLGLPLVTQGITHRLPSPAVRRILGGLRKPMLAANTRPPTNERELCGEAYLDVVPPSFRLPWECDEAFTLCSSPSSFEGSTGSGDFEWLKAMASDRPLVYVTLGNTTTDYRRVWEAIADAVAELDANVLMTIGPHTDLSWFAAVPANVRIERFTPQSEVLAVSSALICHAGFNTLIGAFRAGIPSVCLPVATDQPINASACAAAGAGINAANSDGDGRGPIVDPATLSAARVRSAVNAILCEPRYREAAARLGDEIRNMPTAERIAETLEHRLRAMAA
jgi:UDP:flavonoid glycosyltransferase YjiC (YdhE family)